MKKRTRNLIITACVAVVVAAAVLVGVFVVRPMVTEKKISVKDWEDFYHEEVPLPDIPWYLLKNYAGANGVTAGGYYAEPLPSNRMVLPIDVHYYSSPDASGEPALTVAKGTEVAVYFGELGHGETDYVEAGYGFCCFPDYEKGWRYGIPFTAEDLSQNVSVDWEENATRYYVQTSELDEVARVYVEENKDSPAIQEMIEVIGGKDEFIHWLVRSCDHFMENGGFFDSPDYP